MPDWNSILKQHESLVWRTAYRLLGNEADASDCFQETFLSALDVVKRQVVINWPGLLQRLATSRALDHLRRRIRERQRSTGMTEWDGVPAGGYGPLLRVQADELGGQLRQALAELPPQQSQVFCLRHLNGMSYDEIASELDISVDVVGVTLHRARARLRELLVSACEDQMQR